MSNSEKLCVNCIYAGGPSFFGPYCMLTKSVSNKNLVDGSTYIIYKKCTDERYTDSASSCGIQAKNYAEKKKSISTEIKEIWLEIKGLFC